MQILPISTDDHCWERRDTWTSRVPQAFREACPQVRRRDDGVDEWWYAGEPVRELGTGCAALMQDRGPVKNWDLVPEAAYEPAVRLERMDEDGVAAEVLFPQAAGFGGGPFVSTKGDAELRLACIRAYNDWMAEEWSDFSPRFIAQCLAPLWDVDLAIAEVERAHALGHRALVWTAAPQSFGFPHFNDRYWDKLWALLEERRMPVCLHIGSARSQVDVWDGFSGMKRVSVSSVNAITGNVHVMNNLIFSGVLERFPGLSFVSVESGLGWVPYLLETADHQYEAQHLWDEGMKLRPSEYFRRQCYVNFWFESSGVQLRHMIGVDNILWEADFPHPTSTYPDSRRMIRECLADVPVDEQVKMLQDNAARLFQIDLAQLQVPGDVLYTPAA
jgi:predicted TIM-barrel fold metal-dependent hydrolase